MDLHTQIEAYLSTLPPTKQADLQRLHQYICALMPNCTLWFLDGKNELGKTISNPNIGYGQHIITQANGKTRTFYKIGICATGSGISVYFMGTPSKTYLAEKLGSNIGKAKVSGYCVSFSSLKQIHLPTLEATIRDFLI